MRPSINSLRIAALALVLLSTSLAHASEPVRAQRHATREQALALLQREGFYHPSTHQVLSATWHQDIQEWLVTLKLRDGTQTHTVDFAYSQVNDPKSFQAIKAHHDRD